MLHCASERNIIQSTCELWLRCVHDARLKTKSAKAQSRLWQLLAAGGKEHLPRSQRVRLRTHFGRRIPQYAAELFSVQQELQHPAFSSACGYDASDGSALLSNQTSTLVQHRRNPSSGGTVARVERV
jgi:hypothetical protein